MSHPGRSWPYRIRQVRRHDETNAREDRDRKHPQIPRDHERNEVVEPDFGPLIETAFERCETIEKNNHGRERDVVSNNGDEPEDVLIVTELRGPTDPDRSDHENDLGENEVKQPELFG